MQKTSAVVIDAGLGVWAVLPVFASIDVLERFASWRRAGLEVVAPGLWLAECTSAIRRSVHTQIISAEEGRIALENLFALEVTTVAMDAQQCRSALAWAERLGQARAYDGFYLTLAEERGAELWTADGRLANGARQLGATWVHWLGREGAGR